MSDYCITDISLADRLTDSLHDLPCVATAIVLLRKIDQQEWSANQLLFCAGQFFLESMLPLVQVVLAAVPT